MMAKIVNAMVLECVGEAHKTGKKKQGAVGGEENKRRVVILCVYMWLGITQTHGIGIRPKPRITYISIYTNSDWFFHTHICRGKYN